MSDSGSGVIKFSTGGNAEKMRIDSNGNLLVGTTSYGPGSSNTNTGCTLDGGLGIVYASRSDGASAIFNINVDAELVRFHRSGSLVGNITVTTTATAYNTSSDYRLKNITGSVVDSGTFIDALKPKVGTWKADGSKFVGFLAHEFAEVSPLSVSGEKDAVDAEGNPKYQGMQAGTAEVIANLVAELQSLRKRLAALEAK
jgi:hypothetical protein